MKSKPNLFWSQFSVGDCVSFDSPTQGCSGKGHIFGISTYGDCPIDYMIALEDTHVVKAGILEEEITLLREAKEEQIG